MQSWRSSFLEALANTASGFAIAMLLNWWLVPLFTGVPFSVSQSFWLTVIFTAVTMARSYIFRRAFNQWGQHEQRDQQSGTL